MEMVVGFSHAFGKAWSLFFLRGRDERVLHVAVGLCRFAVVGSVSHAVEEVGLLWHDGLL